MSRLLVGLVRRRFLRAMEGERCKRSSSMIKIEVVKAHWFRKRRVLLGCFSQLRNATGCVRGDARWTLMVTVPLWSISLSPVAIGPCRGQGAKQACMDSPSLFLPPSLAQVHVHHTPCQVLHAFLIWHLLFHLIKEPPYLCRQRILLLQLLGALVSRARYAILERREVGGSK